MVNFMAQASTNLPSSASDDEIEELPASLGRAPAVTVSRAATAPATTSSSVRHASRLDSHAPNELKLLKQ